MTLLVMIFVDLFRWLAAARERVHIIRNKLARGSADGKNDFQVGRLFFSDLPGEAGGGPWGYLELGESWRSIRGGPGT